jgi:transposase
MNRSELVGETLRATLNVLATVDPEWLSSNVETAWFLNYAKRFESGGQPRTKERVIAAAEEVGRDGMALLESIWPERTPEYLRSLPAVETLRQCWLSQFFLDDGVLRWRHAGNLPPHPLVLTHHTIWTLYA